MKPVKEELSDIFNDIPVDGSNIKDDDDDDNGYDNLGGTSGLTFADKVAELSEKVSVAPSVKALPIAEQAKAEPVVKEPAKSVTPAATPVATSTPKDTEALLKAAVASTPVHVSDPAGEVVFETSSAPTVQPVVPEEKGSLETVTTLISEEKIADKECMGEVEKTPVEETEESDSEQSETTVEVAQKVKGDELPNDDDFDPEAWHLTPPSPKFTEMYLAKRRAIGYMLPGGKLPFERFEREIEEANINPNTVTYDLNELYERMQDIQGYKHRVLDIKLQAEHQFFLWKRHMEMFRGWAARVEGAKGAAVEGVAYQHLWDWEKYWGQLESLAKTSEGVMRTLEGAYDCLSRQVTIILDSNRANRDGTRFEQKEFRVPEQQPEVSTPRQDMTKYDSLDGTTNHPPAKKKAVDMDGWEVVR